MSMAAPSGGRRRIVPRCARACLLACLLALAGPAARAGTACTGAALQPAEVRQAMDLAARVYAALDASGARVALVARAGQDLSRYGLRYSHMAFVWRDHPQGRWLVVHELNACGTAQSALFNDGLGNFFLDKMYRYEALILSPGEQQALAGILATAAPQQLHDARYNLLAYPFAQRYQNSNQWVLETYAAAVSGQPDSSRAQAQAWLEAAGYRPITVEIDALTRLGARMFRANVAFDDQPFGRRMAGHIDTVTVESVRRFVRARDPLARELELR
jgi:hypothetical protein